MRLYMFRAVPLPIIRSLFNVHSAGAGWNSVPSCSCSTAVYKPVWHISMLSVQWINSWWWAEELSETCRVSCRSKFGKLVHLVGFIVKKFVMMHGHMNVKLGRFTCQEYDEYIYFQSHLLNIERNFSVHMACIFDVWDGEGLWLLDMYGWS